MKRFFFILIILFLSLELMSQSYNSYFNQFEIKMYYGFMIPHHNQLSYLINKNVALGEINYSIKTDGSKPWHHTWRFPEVGIAYQIGGLGNINVFGFSQSIFAFFGVPIIETDKIIFKYRIGGGLSFISDKFDSRANYYNLAIGSHLNAIVHLSALCDYKPFEIPLYFTGGIGYSNFNNGAIETPNLGLNQITTTLGVKYLYSVYNYSLPKNQAQYMYNSELELSAYYSASIKENYTNNSSKYFVNSINFDAASRIAKKRSIGGGLNIIYDPSLKPLLADEYKNASNLIRLGAHVMQEVYLTDEFSIPMNIGVYLLNSYQPEGKKVWVYSKFGLRYTIEDFVFFNINFKYHIKSADYIELGVGMRLY